MKTPETFKDFILRVHPDPDSITHIRTGRRTEEYLESEAVYKLAEQYVKSMPEDAEKELIAFAEYYDTLSPVEKCTVHSPNGSGTGLYLKPTKDILTQFRNKQQDR